MIRVGILGIHGRMGQWIANLLRSEFASSANLFAQASRGDSLDPLLECDVVIDFSSPQAMSQLAQLAVKHHKRIPAFVVGSTGWSEEESKFLQSLAKKTVVLTSSNFSLGVLLLSEILKKFSASFEKLNYTPVIVETHHRHKKDAPSGTALSLQKAICPDQPKRTQTHSIRAGEVIGIHEIHYYGTADQVSITHHAQDRSIFARGAIEVALWLAQNRETSVPNQGIIGMEHYFDSLMKE